MVRRGVILLVAILFFMGSVLALDKGYCATAEVTSINPSSVGEDEEFTVGIQIDNCGDKIPQDIVFEITRHSEDIKIKESLINSIGEMGYANSKRFIVYHMHSSFDATPGEHIFETKLTYGGGDFYEEKKGNFSITINTLKPDLAISRVYTNPEIIYSGDKIILTIDVENAGNGAAKDVRVEIEDLNLIGVKQEYLGKIEHDENVPARFVLEGVDEGTHSGDVKISYKFGGKIRELEFPIEIQIFSKGINKFYIVAVTLVLGILGSFLFGRKSNSKN